MTDTALKKTDTSSEAGSMAGMRESIVGLNE